MSMVALSITGMTCSGCSGTVERVLKAVPGVTRVDITLTPGRAMVEFDAALVAPAALVHVIEKAGFSARVAS
jgi:copper chaperone